MARNNLSGDQVLYVIYCMNLHVQAKWPKIECFYDAGSHRQNSFSKLGSKRGRDIGGMSDSCRTRLG